MSGLSVSIGDIEFKNPVVVASGDPTGNYENMKKSIEAGAGAIVAKSISFSKDLDHSYKNARWYCVDEKRQLAGGRVPDNFSFFGRGGIPMETPDWMDTLSRVREVCDQHNSVLIGSIAAGPMEKMQDAAVRMERAGCHMLELDAGCPFPDELKLCERDRELVRSMDVAGLITKRIKQAVRVPVIYKATPQVSDVLAMAKAVNDCGGEGITLTNRHLGFLVDIESGEPLIGGWGGIGGPWALPLTLRWVSKVHQAIPQLPIAGSNGAVDWKDAIQFLMSGATLVQYCTILMLKGYSVIPGILQGLENFLVRKKYGGVDEIIGLAVRKAKTYEQLWDKKRARLDLDLCSDCGTCLETCFYGGMRRDPNGYIHISEGCIGCGICETVCPFGAITLV